MIDQLLGPKILALAGAAAATTVGLKFGQTISVTAIVVSALVVVLGGLFTLRNNIRSFWRDLAEERGAQVVELEAEVRELNAKLLASQHAHAEQILAEANAQRELRHQLKGEVATLQHQLELESAKHDLSSVTARLKALEDLAVQRAAMFDRLDHTTERLAGLLDKREGGSTG